MERSWSIVGAFVRVQTLGDTFGAWTREEDKEENQSKHVEEVEANW